ncbi:unnamed protein product [[Candida] boidinii]|nr:unnamed protein product [[Candida] boidinii]
MCQEFEINENEESLQSKDSNDNNNNNDNNNESTTENPSSERTIKINALIGSKFIKLHKVVLNNISILETFFNSLRSWSFLNSLLSNLFENTITYEERDSNITNANLTDITAVANASSSNSNNNDNYNYEDITINELIKRHLPELKNRENSRNAEVYKSENKLVINIESLYDYNNIITLKVSNTEFIIKNGEVLVTHETFENSETNNNNNDNIINNKKLGEILNKTEEIFEVFKAQNLI